jgi:putative transposase
MSLLDLPNIYVLVPQQEIGSRRTKLHRKSENPDFLVRFMPLARRTIQPSGLSLFNLRYWHPIFAAWRALRRQVVVRYHPEDLSRIYVTADGKRYVEVGFADIRRPPISLWEHRAACRHLRAQGQRELSDVQIFKAIEDQRRIVEAARRETQRAQRRTPRKPAVAAGPWAPAPTTEPSAPVDYGHPAPDLHVELWDNPCPTPR